MNSRLLISLMVLILGWLAWTATNTFTGSIAASEMRQLSNYRVEALPVDLSEKWKRQLDSVLASQSEVPLLDPNTLSVARAAVNELPWIDPVSVKVGLDLPSGIRVEFRPRTPIALIRWEGKNYAVSMKGFIIPDGLPEVALERLPLILLEDEAELPEPGRRVANPLVQASIAALDEYHAIRKNFKLDLVAIERMPGYPLKSPGVSPAVAFVTRDGKRILWGRSLGASGPLAISLDQKVRRLTVIEKDYPQLEGLGQVHLHTSQVRLFSPSGKLMPLPSMPEIAATE